MKAIKLLFTLLIFCSLAQASLIGKLFNQRRHKTTELHPLKDIIDERNRAHLAWVEFQRNLPDVHDPTWQTKIGSFEEVWMKYGQAREKLRENANRLLQSSLKEFTEAESAVKQTTEGLRDYLGQFEDTKGSLKESFFTSLDELLESSSSSRKKYAKAKENLSNYFDQMHDNMLEDYQAVAKYLSNTIDKLTTYGTSKAKNPEVEKNLKNMQDKAREAFSDIKSKYRELKTNINHFDTNATEHANTWLEWLKARVAWATDWLKSYKDNAEHKTSNTYDQFLKRIQRLDALFNYELHEAEDSMIKMKNWAKRYASDALDSIRQKFLNLKDEL